MATHDFTDEEATWAETKQSHRKLLTQQSGDIIAKLTVFKATYDELYSMSSSAQQANLSTKFTEFKLEAKDALGL